MEEVAAFSVVDMIFCYLSGFEFADLIGFVWSLPDQFSGFFMILVKLVVQFGQDVNVPGFPIIAMWMVVEIAFSCHGMNDSVVWLT